MWERQYEHGRWNGHKLNILSTAIDGGQRLHVVEIPYEDLPHIKVMGSKARTFNFEIVFVGTSSLADANAFIANCEASPEGELEHPWLGELKLVYQSYSQNISTKRGLVTLSLSFVRAGISPTISAPSIVRTREQASAVEKISTKVFVKDVEEMSVAEIAQTQDDFTKMHDALVDITNRLDLDDEKKQDINNALNTAYSAISSISNDPEDFASLMSIAVDAVAEGVQLEPDSISEAANHARSAQAFMLGLMGEEPPSTHYNTQLVTAAVKMSENLTELEAVDTYDVTA
ncbi:DNA circularization N-terminal domain-containing protein [Vibrio rotiferianus]|uniref:DNA circularization N-terminal domain-containing protein n=1 Tax=Vibrio rotiferianus TaxID=190895 RepID=UPI0039801277